MSVYRTIGPLVLYSQDGEKRLRITRGTYSHRNRVRLFLYLRVLFELKRNHVVILSAFKGH